MEEEMKKVIAIANYKGGVGKTTTAANLAYNLAAIHEKNVLMVDADSSRNLSVFYKKYNEGRPGLPELLNESCGVSASRTIQRTRFKRLDIIQSKRDLEDTNITRDSIFLFSDPKFDTYDYIIIDCHPDFSDVTESVLLASDMVIVPIKVDRNAINGLELMEECIDGVNKWRGLYDKKEIEIKVLVTMYQNNRVSRMGVQELATISSIPLFRSVIRNTCKCVESIEKKKPLLKCASKSTACLDYIAFTDEVIGGE